VQNLTLQGNAAYLVTVSPSGDHQDERQTFIVHTPINGNLNVNFSRILNSSYVWPTQASITVSTQAGGGGWQANNSANCTLRISYLSGGNAATWAYSAVKI
jgi:hypothetical protein